MDATEKGLTTADQLAALREELAQARAALGDFTYAVSHDLRAPLRHITSYAQILREDLQDAAGGLPLSPDLQASLDAISAAAKNQAALIDGLTTLARVGQAAVHPQALSLDPLVQDIRAGLDQELAQAARTVHWRVAPGLPTVLADLPLLRMVLQQVLGNACKFTRQRALAQIEIDAVAADGRCILSIRDNGAGFNPQYTDKLFKALTRLHGAIAFDGIGMGLALSRAALHRMHGTVSAEGVVDGGCTVRVELPLAA